MDKTFRCVENDDECSGEGTSKLMMKWIELREENKAPQAARFDFLHYPELLGTMVVLDAVEGGEDFEIRYTGTDISRLFGAEYTGHRLKDLCERYKSDAQRSLFMSNTLEVMSMCHKRCLPVLNGPRQMTFTPKSFLRIETLAVPFIDKDRAVIQLAGTIDFLDG